MALELTSSAFEHEGMIPAKYNGQDISPPLTPEGTESFVLICDDPDAPVGTWVHWVSSTSRRRRDRCRRRLPPSRSLHTARPE